MSVPIYSDLSGFVSVTGNASTAIRPYVTNDEADRKPAAPTDDTPHPSDVPTYPVVSQSSSHWLAAMRNEEKITYEQGCVRALAAMDVLDRRI